MCSECFPSNYVLEVLKEEFSIIENKYDDFYNGLCPVDDSDRIEQLDEFAELIVDFKRTLCGFYGHECEKIDCKNAQP